jgi:hypothetical protein
VDRARALAKSQGEQAGAQQNETGNSHGEETKGSEFVTHHI